MNSILGGCTVCPTSDVSHTVTFILYTLDDVPLLDTVRSSGASRILRVWIVYTRGQLYMYIQNNTVEVQNPTHRKVTRSSIAATLPVLSPSNIFSPTACHYAFISRGNFRRVVKNCYYFKWIGFLKNCLRLKLCNWKLLQSSNVCGDNTSYQLIRWIMWQMSEQTLGQGKPTHSKNPPACCIPTTNLAQNDLQLNL